MAAIVTFTATTAQGTTETRSSGTMPYVAASVLVDADGNQTVYSWHKTVAAAHTAARNGLTSRVATHRGLTAGVIPVVPTAIKGKVTEAMFAEGWGDIPADVMLALVAAKNGTTEQPELPTEEAPAQDVADEPEVEETPEVADEAPAELVRVDGKPQARLDTATGKLVWRNSPKGRAARAAGLWN